jgi:hypothetical protein
VVSVVEFDCSADHVRLRKADKAIVNRQLILEHVNG